MGLSKRLQEEQFHTYNLSELLETLLNNEAISHPVSQGVAKQIIGKSLSGLSTKQRYVYREYIEKLFDVECSNCNTKLDSCELDNSYKHESEYGNFLCENCIFVKLRIEKLTNEN